MADDATATVDRSGRTAVAVYCGAGLPVEVPLAPPTTVVALGKAVVDKLRESRELAHITPLDVVLWRVSRGDARKLRHGCDLSDATSRVELDPEDAIVDDTFTADHRIWVQLLGGGACAGRGALAIPVRPLICTTLPPSINVLTRFPSACCDRATRLQARP